MAKIKTGQQWAGIYWTSHFELQEIVAQAQAEVFDELKHRAVEICLDAGNECRSPEYASHRIRDLHMSDLR